MKLLPLILITLLTPLGVFTNPLQGQWHLTVSSGASIDIQIDENSISNLNNPLDSSLYTLEGDVLFLYDSYWIIHIFSPNQIGILGWAFNSENGYFPQFIHLDRIVEDVPIS